jgi:hypothetical protein
MRRAMKVSVACFQYDLREVTNLQSSVRRKKINTNLAQCLAPFAVKAHKATHIILNAGHTITEYKVKMSSSIIYSSCKYTMTPDWPTTDVVYFIVFPPAFSNANFSCCHISTLSTTVG